MVRVVRAADGQMVPFKTWQVQEQIRLAALAAAEAERNARMPQSGKEEFDFSQRIPSSIKATYDFEQ